MNQYLRRSPFREEGDKRVTVRMLISARPAASSPKGRHGSKDSGNRHSQECADGSVATVVEKEIDGGLEQQIEYEGRRFGASTRERGHLVAWLRERGAEEVVMESTA